MDSKNVIQVKYRLAPVIGGLSWMLVLLVLWWILVEGRLDALWFALPVLLLSEYLRRVLPVSLPFRRLHVVALLRFVPLFLWGVLLGGTDVAMRALLPRRFVDPRCFEFPLRLKSDGSRVFLAHIISLMPGTLSCRIDHHAITVHALNGRTEEALLETMALEEQVARIFNEPLEDEG